MLSIRQAAFRRRPVEDDLNSEFRIKNAEFRQNTNLEEIKVCLSVGGLQFSSDFLECFSFGGTGFV